MDDSERVALVGRRIQFPRLKAIWPPRVETRPAVVVAESRDDEDDTVVRGAN